MTPDKVLSKLTEEAIAARCSAFSTRHGFPLGENETTLGELSGFSMEDIVSDSRNKPDP